uniref:Uncharacterized protein n=1 Tax=Poecilia reticulata TaxID=8081 RepID=A0A3P9NZS2_POERE
MLPAKISQSWTLLTDSSSELRDAPVLVFTNKQDLPGVMSVDDITEALSLSGVRGSSCAVSGAGLVEGLDWLSDQILKK